MSARRAYEAVAWAAVDERRFDRPARVLRERNLGPIRYELCARSGLFWVRRIEEGPNGLAIADSQPTGKRATDELWRKILGEYAP